MNGQPHNHLYTLWKLCLLALLTAVGATAAQGVTTDIYERGGGTAWSTGDLSEWTATDAGANPVFEINGGLKTGAGNSAYEYHRDISADGNSQLTITATWNTGESTGRDDGYNYLCFGTVELRAYGQASRGTIVIGNEEFVLTNSTSDVRGDKDWTVTLTITQSTGHVAYTVLMPTAGTVTGNGTAGVLDFSAIRMGYHKVGSLTSTHQTLKAIRISETKYSYTLRAIVNSTPQTIATGSDGPGTLINKPYSHYILDGTTLYVADRQGSDPHYGKSFELDADNKTVDITYTSHATDVALWREAEDFMTRSTEDNNVRIRCSGMQGGYSASTPVVVGTLPTGVYRITAASYAKNLNYAFSVGSASVWTHTSAAGSWSEQTSGNLQFSTAEALKVVGGREHYPLDYVYVQRVFAYETANANYDMSSSTTATPTLVNPGSHIVTYSSSNTEVATVNAGTGEVTFLHNGTAVIRATATIGYTEHTVIITGESEATATWTPATPADGEAETLTISGLGYLSATTTSHSSRITVELGNSSETRTVEPQYGKAALRAIDANGYSHAYAPTNNIPTMGTYYVFRPAVSGTISLHALTTAVNGIRLVDRDGNILEEKTTDAGNVNTWKDYAFNTLLAANGIYYVYAETGAGADNDENYPTLHLNSLTFTPLSGTTISLIDQSLLFTPGNNSNNQRLDRTIPGFTLTFSGGDGAKYEGAGTFILRNKEADSEDENGAITITPRIKTGSASDVTITQVTLNTAGTGGSPSVYINGTDQGAVSANSTHTYSGLSGQTLTIKLKGSGTSNSIWFRLNSITILYNLANGATLDLEPLDDQVELQFANKYLYGYTDQTADCDIYFYKPKAFYGDVTFTYSNTTFGNGCANAVTKHKENDELVHLNDGNSADPYKVRIGSGMSLLTASYAGSSYFNASTATIRLYSRDYEETDVVLAAGEEYTVPAANGLAFAVTTSGGTVTLNGTANSPDATLSDGQRFLTTATASSVTIRNTGSTSLTLTKIEVYRKQGTLSFSYQGNGAENNVFFAGESYLPDEFTITGENNISNRYETTGTYSLVSPYEGITIDPSTGRITLDSETAKGFVEVMLTVNPKDEYKALYAPVSATVRLTVTDGMWDFRTFSAAEQASFSGSPGWTVQSYYASRDNADFDYLLRGDGTPLPRALALQTKGRHRLLYNNKGFLHLQGKGVGNNVSPNGGGQLLVPVKEGMLVELNAYSEDLLSEMEIEGVTALDGSSVSTIYADPWPAQSQYFLASRDGYIVIKNPSFNLDLHVCYVKVSADMAFKYGNETYVDAQAGKWTNPVMNAGETTLSYAFAEAPTPSDMGSVNSTTGEVTIGAGKFGHFTVTATGTGTGLLAGNTGTYTAYVIGFETSNESRTIDQSHTFDLTSRLTITNTSGTADDGTLMGLVTFSLDTPTASATLTGTTLTIDGVQTVTVRATLGSISKTFTCAITGGTLADGLNPVIPNDQDSYTFQIEGESAHQFNVKKMYDDIMGDLAADKSGLKFYVGNREEVDPTLSSSEAVASDTLRIEGFSSIKKGGVIPIYASYEHSSTTYEIEGTLTVAYSSHTWNFQSSNLIPGLRDWQTADDSGTAAWNVDYATIDQPADGGVRSDAYHWKFVRKIGGHSDTSPIYYYNHPVEGDNALAISQTEGLHIYATPDNRQMGVEMMNEDGVANVPYDCRNLMLLRGARITIPCLKAGQWVEVRWTRHKEEEGERILMDNLSDFDGTPITSTYKIGNCFYNLPWSTSTYMFQATKDGDVTFEMADNIYVSIQQIELHDPSWTPVSSIVSQLNGYDDTVTPTPEYKTTYNDYVDAPKVRWQYVWYDDAAEHTITILSKEFQNAPNAPQTWKFALDEMLTRSGAEMVVSGPDNSAATITYKGGWGKVKVTMTCYSQNMKYVANKKEWTLTFGQAPRQTYPYTWDFTKYFASTESGISIDTWNTGDKSVRYDDYNTQNYTRSYYVEGAQLVSYGLRNLNNGVLRETDGLGFHLDTNSDGTPEATLQLKMENHDIENSGATAHLNTGTSYQTWETVDGGMSLGAGAQVIVPKPGDDYANCYIYIRSTEEPTAWTASVKRMVSGTPADATLEEQDTQYDVTPALGQYKFHFQSNQHATFTFGTAATVRAIAVSKERKQLKALSANGWATESRSYAVDYTLDSLLTVNPLRAYAVIERSGNPVYSDNHTKTTVALTDRRYVVPAGQGLVLRQLQRHNGTSHAAIGDADFTTYTVPLFVPAVTTARDADYRYTGNLMRPCLNERTFTAETENLDGSDGTDYTVFIFTNRYMTWRKNTDGSVSYDDHFTDGTVPSFYRMHRYGDTGYDSGTERNTLGANKAYLLLRTDRINPVVWETASPARRFDFVGIQGVSDMADELYMQPTDDASQLPADGHTYNLNGQPIDTSQPLPPGIYVRNGKKIMIRQ